MNSKVMNKVLSFLLVAAVAFTTIFTPVNAATVNSRDKKYKGKIKSMKIFDNEVEIPNKGAIEIPVSQAKTLNVVFEDKGKKEASHVVTVKSNNKKAVVVDTDYEDNESTVTLTPASTAKAGDKATITVKSKAKKVKTVKFTVTLIDQVALTGVELSITAPKVGSTITATPVPANADTTG